MPDSFLNDLRNLANDIFKCFQLPFNFNPEDQLKPPMKQLIKEMGTLLSLQVLSVTEVPEHTIGRPDLGIAEKSLLIGHIELKAPGKGANPELYKGSDKEQWIRFKDLPNLIYTDWNEWALYRHGEKVGTTVRFSGDVPTKGKKAISEQDAEDLFSLLRDFLFWQPISPTSSRALAKQLAPICRLLRNDVLDELKNPNSNLSALVRDWRTFLFSDADDNTFADAYAQTITYTLLLARLSGEDVSSISDAVRQIRTRHAFLSEVLKVLGDDQAQKGIEMPIQLLERLITVIDPSALAKKGDPWLYFYEEFLAAYDPKLRDDRGAYYTPVEVVQAQVRLVDELLEKDFFAHDSFADKNVITLDPAVGTGTYLLGALALALEKIEKKKGLGMRRAAATQAASNMHGFEIMVGPYTVSHLRLSQALSAENADLPEDGVHIYLTDTLESPDSLPVEVPLFYKGWEREHERARKIKKDSPVLVCIGNPPYDRQQVDPKESSIKRKGGWIRFGEKSNRTLFDDFTEPLTKLGLGVHAKNLYNDYVYFWRWALWKIIEQGGSGIVSFITASSYLRGPGFAGMRNFMREAFDDLWIIDLEGDNLGTRKTENVFSIQSPVAIAIGVRYKIEKRHHLAITHYAKLSGTREEKLEELNSIENSSDLEWRNCLSGKIDPFLPINKTNFWHFPLLTDLFPWQENGIQYKRSWPIGETEELIKKRWKTLLKEDPARRGELLHETSARIASKRVTNIDGTFLPALSRLPVEANPHKVDRYSYRSFDRQWAILDPRVIDRPRPELQRAHNNHQLYLTSMLTNVIGEGPSSIVTNLLPDLDHFRGSFGARHIIPLWQPGEAIQPNITKGILEKIRTSLNKSISPDEFFAYAYAILFAPDYVRTYWDELTIPGPRLPITKDSSAFMESVEVGKQLIFLHTFAERFVPKDQILGQIPQGKARCKVGVPSNKEEYPEKFSYNEGAKEIIVGKGIFNNVRPEVWNFSVSGLQVVKSWLAYRMKKRAGKKSSPLDEIRPEAWTFDNEFLDLLWVLDHTVDLIPEVNQNLKKVLSGDLFQSEDFPKPTKIEKHSKNTLMLFDDSALEDQDDNNDE